MVLPAAVESIAGAQDVYNWFGYWPDFHDAEVISCRLESSAPSSLLVHTWEMTNKVDSKGLYELKKHVVVEFIIESIQSINVQDPWDHSILLDLSVEKSETGFRVNFSAAYGLSGTIEAQGLSLRITPGKPSKGPLC